MNALDELREIADLQERGLAFVEIGQLRQIADRIEAEYMELPCDKNGEVIHVGDTVSSGFETWEVAGIADDGDLVTEVDYALGLMSDASMCELVKPDTIERVKADVSNMCDGESHSQNNWEKLIDRAYECGKRDAE